MRGSSTLSAAVAPERPDGFAFVEILVAMAVVAIFAGSTIWSLSQLNRFAFTSRLHTAAMVLAQEQIDEIQTAAPFNPQRTPPQIPLVLATTGASGSIETSLPLYTDPATGEVVVTASRTRIVEEVDAVRRIFRGRSVVNYSVHDRNHSVELTTLRTSDN